MRVIAHRAIAKGAPENLVSSIAAARDAGANAVEIDVRVTRDGVPVLSHDPVPWRTTRTLLPVKWLTAHSFGRLRDRRSSEELPTLAAAIEAARQVGLGVVLDLKVEDALDAAASAVDLTAVTNGLDLWVRSPELVEHARELVPNATLGLLRDTSSLRSTLRYADDAAAVGADLVSVHAKQASEEARDHARSLGLQFVVWVEKFNQQAAAVVLEPDGIVTDWPELVVRS